jgi:hypothetical protein
MAITVRRTARALCALVLASLGAAAPAAAKGFGPGDLVICDARRCAPVMERKAVDVASALIFTGQQPRLVPAPRLGARSFELRYRTGYVIGMVGGPKLGRFLSYGVVLERFDRGSWYQVPPTLARELRALTTGFRPAPITARSLRRAR